MPVTYELATPDTVALLHLVREKHHETRGLDAVRFGVLMARGPVFQGEKKTPGRLWTGNALSEEKSQPGAQWGKNGLPSILAPARHTLTIIAGGAR